MALPRNVLVLPDDTHALNATIAAVPVPCTLNDWTTGAILTLNRHMRTLVGLAPDAPLDDVTTNRFYVSPTRRAELVTTLQETGLVQDVEFDAVRLDGTHVPCLASYQAARWRGQIVILACLTDISARKAAERALRESEKKYRAITENTSDVVWQLDLDLTIREVAGGHQVLAWLDRAPLIGQRAQVAFTPDGAAHLEQAMRRRIDQERRGVPTTTTRHEIEAVNRHGERLWVELMVYPHRDETDALVGLFGVMRDISERRRANEALRHSETLFRHLFDANPVVKLLVDPATGRIVKANPCAARFYGASLDAMRNEPLARFVVTDPTDTTPFLDALRDAAAHDGAVVEQTHRLETGATRRVAAHVSYADVAIETVESRRLLNISLFDITDRTQQAENLRRHNIAVRDFSAAVSHDLQEPLRMVSSYLGLVRRHLGETITPDIQEFIEYATDGTARMRSMLHDLLAYARLDTDARPLQSVALSATVQTVLDMMRLRLDEIGALVTVAPDLPAVRGTPDQIVSLIQNLIGNALRYRAHDRRLEITVDWAPQDAMVEVRIHDNGIGIAPQDHDRVFGVFQRLSLATDGEPGTGMGLAICRRIVHRHGGQIGIASTPGAGTTFRFTLPLAPSEPCLRPAP
ncbi:PAS domain S-box protein [Roseospira marina]|uniref:histidine kinase n=1 Tax=Roseospira marina TaxID=140057 RepID=A0A5M6IHE3_9PROT|nr:ATP-binding protein [Roseospira marina]KAA5607045.1 PAS domain S-box protein [Roseospira marina]MBB4312767.1 PAS domain S-box-containing protein [Roseospira marina]MBB5086460.1 PAS domain S-box-containing protein [Roseospira marina]